MSVAITHVFNLPIIYSHLCCFHMFINVQNVLILILYHCGKQSKYHLNVVRVGKVFFLKIQYENASQ